VQAFKVSAIDYLLKPVDLQDLKDAIAKLDDKISGEEAAQKLEILYQNIQNRKNGPCKISIPTINGLMFLQTDLIVRCQSDVNYTHIYLKDKQRIVVAKTLKDFEELLQPFNFFRIHNSHIVNMTCVRSYHKGKGGYVTLDDHTELEVSTRRKEAFLKLMLQNPLK
jgi:two-component system LytT family response regulator